MPEAVEVHTIASVLNDMLAGQELTAIKYDTKSKFSRRPIRDLDKVQKEFPSRIVSVTARGKKIIFTLDAGQYLVSSLGMEGHWVTEPESHSNLWLEYGKSHRIYYDDSRHFGDFKVALDSKGLAAALDAVGLCLVTQRDQITPEWWAGCFSNRRVKMSVADFLLSQERFSGIGNWLRAEILYRARINPHRRPCELTPTEVETIRRATFDIIDEAMKCHGVTVSTYKDPLGRTGTFERACYGKKTDPLGNTVQQDKSRGRTIHWVPAVQV